VVFDLFGTLIRSMSTDGFEQTLSNMADILSAERSDFIKQWIFETWDKRRRGVFKTVDANIEYICNALGLDPSAEKISKAAETRYDYSRNLLFHPREGAIDTLEALRHNGLKIGLLTNCSADIPHLWPETSFSNLINSPIFSCSVGVVKPEPESYWSVCKALDVEPRFCVYVGDGSDRELTGARRVGMHPVLIMGPDKDPFDEQLDRKEWKGPTITQIGDLLDTIDREEWQAVV
jgi:putative hydrolase of the HAD superfamily